MGKDFDIEIKKYLTNGEKLSKNYNLDVVPNTDGIYIVECPDGVVPKFSDKTRAIKTRVKKGKVESTEKYTAKELQIKYENGNKKILYIGSAPLNEDGKRGLKERIGELIDHGYNMGKNHYGGKELWQIKNIENMNLYWCSVENARETEHDLLILHLKKYPFFNKKNKIKKSFSYPLANSKN